MLLVRRQNMPFLNLVTLLLAVSTGIALATPLEDLASASREVRDAAARELRASFVPPLRSKWEPVVAVIKPGDRKEYVMGLLEPFNVTTEFGVGSGQSFSESYRLDDVWLLTCYFQGTGKTAEVIRASLTEQLRHIWVAPASTFSGTWTVYFVNGQRSHEINYADGRYFGTFTAFRPDGSKAYVQHYGAWGIDGEDTGYFPSGRVSYRAFYKNGSPVGTWTHYNEDGSVRSTKEYGEAGK